MKVTENSIIPIYQDRAIDGELAHEQYVNARELWEKLGSKQEFAAWIKNRIENYEFSEGDDYFSFDKSIKRGIGGTTRTEYMLTIDTAKEIAMVENNAVGKQLRRYFIECEKRYRSFEKVRIKAKAERRVLTDIIKELVPESPHKSWVYKHYTDLVYKVVTGYNAKELRAMHNLDDKANVRQYLSEDEICKVIKFERVIQGLLALGMDYEEIKNVITAAAAGNNLLMGGAN